MPAPSNWIRCSSRASTAKGHPDVEVDLEVLQQHGALGDHATVVDLGTGTGPEAAADGSAATIWAPDPATTTASLTVNLGAATTVTRITPQWTDVLPTSSQIQVSLDGTSWTAAPAADADGNLTKPVSARYVRVGFSHDPSAGRTGLRELEVIRSA